jgi:anhydro-N-acetylmuramic acid kinase
MQRLSKQIRSIGIMTGTSLDGIDLVCIDLEQQNNTWRFKIVASFSAPFTTQMLQDLKSCYSGSAELLARTNFTYTTNIAQAVNSFVDNNQISDIDCIGFHGQTIFHDPNLGYTYQLGNSGVLASLTNKRVIGDFRSQDIALGGQGAPLVPIGDALLFSEYDACLNLGGIANISFKENNKQTGYDICHFNLMLNHYANQLGLSYDDKGNNARNGKIQETLLNQLNAWEYYSQKHPKSLGFESVEKDILPIMRSISTNPDDSLRTWIEHAAIQVSKSINSRWTSILVTGGGAYNDFFIEELQSRTSAKLVIPSNEIIDSKEAIIFAFLAALRLDEQDNCWSEITGAKHNHIAGGIYLP